MENIDEVSFTPSITLAWDPWEQTWFFNRVLRFSERYNVNVKLTLQPGSITVILEVMGHTANIIEITLFIGLLLKYIRTRAEKKNLTPPQLNADATFSKELYKSKSFERKGESKLNLENIRKIYDGFEIIFTDRASTQEFKLNFNEPNEGYHIGEDGILHARLRHINGELHIIIDGKPSKITFKEVRELSDKSRKDE